MTKAQKLILIVLTINAVLLGFGLIVLYRYVGQEQPQTAEPTEVPIQYIDASGCHHQARHDEEQ